MCGANVLEESKVWGIFIGDELRRKWMLSFGTDTAGHRRRDRKHSKLTVNHAHGRSAAVLYFTFSKIRKSETERLEQYVTSVKKIRTIKAI